MIEYDAIIVGAGIGGLNLALNLEKKGLKTLVLERHLEPGGAISSARKDGYILEYGPNTLVLKQELKDLIRNLKIQDRVIKAESDIKKRFIVCANKEDNLALREVPLSIKQGLRTELISNKAKLRLLGSLVTKKRSIGDESAFNFIERHLGEEFAENIFEPAFSGIWASDVKKLSARSALPELWKLEKESGSLTRGLFKKSKNKSSDKHQIISFKGGLKTLVKEMAKQLTDIRFGQNVERIFSIGSAWEVAVRDANTNKLSRISTKSIILTSGQHTTSGLIEKFDSKLAENLLNIPYSPVGLIHLAVDKKSISHPLDGFGCLFQKNRNIPKSLNQPLLGVIFSSKLFKAFAPKDKVLLTCFCGGALNPEAHKISDSNIHKEAIKTLKSLLGISSEPKIISGIEIPKAIPSYPLGHHKVVEHAKEFERSNPGIYLMANYLEGISLNNRLTQSNLFAKKIESSIRIIWGTKFLEKTKSRNPNLKDKTVNTK